MTQSMPTPFLPTIEHLIGGALVAGHGAETAPVFNPATGAETARVRLGTEQDVDDAVAAGREAFARWSQESLARRQAVLFSFREKLVAAEHDLARLITSEHGKLVSDALGEVRRGIEIVEMACGVAQLLKGEYSDSVAGGVDVFSYRQPLGVVAGITPFNFPAMVPLWMSPLAIATGNAFILKPSERDPSTALELARLWAEAGLPDGVFQVVQGDRTVVEALLAHPEVAAVSFVGSTTVARHIHQTATANGKRVQALGSAKNHGVVLADADLDFAADHLVAAAYGAAGQRCMALSVAVVVEEVADALVAKVAERAERIVVGDGAAEGTDMGPLIAPAARDRVVGALGTAESEGARVAVDGRRAATADGGFFVGPSLVDGVTPAMELYREEVFGPVLAVVRVPDLEAAIRLVNSSRYGNGAAIFTRSGYAAREFHRRVTAGMVGVNVPIPVPVAHYSFGGWKDSLFGDRHIYGPEGVSFYTRGKVVTARWPEHEVALGGAPTAPGGASGASFDLPVTR